jgi:hypothetical protein
MSSLLLHVPVGLLFVHPHRFRPLYSARQMSPASTNHDASKLLQPAPSGLVASETIRVAQILGTQPCFLSHHQPHNMKPQTQRLAAVFKNRPSRHRTLSPTSLAMPQPTVCAPRLRDATFWTDKTIWPPNPLHIRRAVFLYRKPGQKLLERLRIGLVSVAFTNPTLPLGVT